jgi:hypothetical protein
MTEYLVEVRRMEKFFDGFEVRYVPRLDNHDAGHLAWIASSKAPIPADVIIEKLTKPSIKTVETLSEIDLMIIDGSEQQPEVDWMSPIKAYLDNQSISDDNVEIERIARKSRMYHLIDGVLYKQGHQWHDDEVYLKRQRHPVTMRDSQRSLRGTFIMMLHSWKSLQARILLADS